MGSEAGRRGVLIVAFDAAQESEIRPVPRTSDAGSWEAMSIEYIKEMAFLQEVRTAGQVWVARSAYENIYSLEIDMTGFSLPVWSNMERVVDYLKNARLVGAKYEPYAVPLDVFTKRWLSDMMMAISELQLNPDGKTTRVLVLSAEEFKATQA